MHKPFESEHKRMMHLIGFSSWNHWVSFGEGKMTTTSELHFDLFSSQSFGVTLKDIECSILIILLKSFWKASIPILYNGIKLQVFSIWVNNASFCIQFVSGHLSPWCTSAVESGVHSCSVHFSMAHNCTSHQEPSISHLRAKHSWAKFRCSLCKSSLNENPPFLWSHLQSLAFSKRKVLVKVKEKGGNVLCNTSRLLNILGRGAKRCF